ncbi:MAG: hypothetical protein MI920_17325, partial [Kiloniellales bacterium]|nr:hypothetical protein [Kiloniellales bacterium]
MPGFGRLTGPSRARRIAVIEELDRRGALPPRKKAVLDELRRRRAWPPPLQTGPQQSIPQQIMGAVGSTARGAVEAVTGEGRRSEDLPELQSMLRQEGRRLITDQRPGEPPTLASPDLITNQRLMGAVDIPASTQGKIAAI